MSLVRIEIYPKEILDSKYDWSKGKVSCKYFLLDFSKSTIATDQLKRKLSEIFDPVLETVYVGQGPENFGKNGMSAYDVSYLPGVTDNPAHAFMEAMDLVGLEGKAYSGMIYFYPASIDQDLAKKEIETYYYNPLIQKCHKYDQKEFLSPERFRKVSVPSVQISPRTNVEIFDFKKKTLDELEIEFAKRHLSFSRIEIESIVAHYKSPEVAAARKQAGLPEGATDVEIEILAQTWSEHCKHKIFASKVKYNENGNDEVIDGLFKQYIKKTTSDVIKKHNIDWTVSLFSDNAGIVRFDESLDACIKVETHNSPSALDPYGGALTGILGVNRDIMGCGIGARPVANMDVFCLPNLELENHPEKYPARVASPKTLMSGVHRGVEDGGNKSGIPTVNGSFFFDDSFRAKPLVFVGTVGLLPRDIDGTSSAIKCAKNGDYIVVAGGAIGLDGIHGATFSSMELNDSSPASAVQIGDPLTQKRLCDFLLVARDRKLYNSVTDNGAGGISSSIGEMATQCGGAEIDVSLPPTKYPGILPWEIMVSESQERMSFAVAPEQLDEFIELAKNYGVVATAIGKFTNSSRLVIKNGPEVVASLDMHFLHEGVPRIECLGIFSDPVVKDVQDEFFHKLKIDETLLKILSSDNVRSKEDWVRKYDHEVGASTILKPYGENGSPHDAGVIWMGPHGGNSEGALGISHGLAPRQGAFDGKYMALWALDEALRSCVAVGANPEKVCVLDNFCWPDPIASEKNTDGKTRMGQLIRTLKGLREYCLELGLPLVSGKDSMKNDYRGPSIAGNQISVGVLPTLLVTAMGHVPVKCLTSVSFKKQDHLIYLIADGKNYFRGSEFDQTIWQNELKNEALVDELNWPDLTELSKRYKNLHQCMIKGWIKSAHDISDGGLIVSLFESMHELNIGATIKFDIDKNDLRTLYLKLFGEGPGQILVSIAKNDQTEFEKCMGVGSFDLLGETTHSQNLKIYSKNECLLEIDIQKMSEAWKSKEGKR